MPVLEIVHGMLAWVRSQTRKSEAIVRVVSVVGARPQFVKLAPVAEALANSGTDHRIVHTGQHYDQLMSEAFFDDLVIPKPDYNLEVGSGSHAQQTGEMMARLELVLETESPDWVLTYGDTNSTLAAAITAAKIHLPLAHLEAGLRSFNKNMPEEHNRVLTDHASDLLLAPTQLAMHNLAAEGLSGRAQLVGDVMADVCLRIAREHRMPKLPAGIKIGDEFLLATIHRAENTDDPDRLNAILAALQAQPIPVILTAHPRLVAKTKSLGVQMSRGAVHSVDPYRYPEMIATMGSAKAVITDSGGLQKEAYLLGVPCTTVRTETEWVETVEAGWNNLDPELANTARWAHPARPQDQATGLYGSGNAAELVAEALINT
jgi:UDP-N-acetylglucosamine 2-epimerase (non-hydrolysing)